MLFLEQISREPNLYPWTREFMEAMWKGHWTDSEFNFSSDIHDFKVNLIEEEREITTKALAAISQVENGVKKFWAKLGENLPHPSIFDMGVVMGHIEVIHNLGYEKLLRVLGLKKTIEEVLKVDIIQNRVNYLHKHNHRYYKDSKKQYIYALILFTLFVENVSLFGQFYIINWFGRFKNVLKDTNQMTQYTRNEETTHALIGIKLINDLRKEYPDLFDEELEQKVITEAKGYLKYEFEIIDWTLGDYKDDKISKEIVKELIAGRLNDSLKQIKFKKITDVDKTILKETKWFNEEILGNNMSDFFHARPVEYAKGGEGFSEDELFD